MRQDIEDSRNSMFRLFLRYKIRKVFYTVKYVWENVT